MLPKYIANPHPYILDRFKMLTPSFLHKNAQNPPFVGITFFQVCYNTFIRGVLFL